MVKQQRKFYLGVEGGATKSTLILVDETDKIQARRTGKALNFHILGKARTKKYLEELLRPVLRKTGKAPVYAVFGLAGVDSKQDETIYEKLARPILPRTYKAHFVNDSEISLEVRCPSDKNRVLIISGTGSNVFGESGSKVSRNTGWDFLLGDEGSGYDFGLKAIRAATRSFDGRGPKTILEKLVPTKAGTKTMEEFMPKFYEIIGDNMHNMKYFIASFAPLLDIAIQKGDTVAMDIRKQAIEELTLSVTVLAKDLDIANESFCFGFAGSTWKMPGFQDNLKKEVKKRFPKVCFSDNTDEGAWGAVLLAKKLAHV